MDSGCERVSVDGHARQRDLLRHTVRGKFGRTHKQQSTFTFDDMQEAVCVEGQWKARERQWKGSGRAAEGQRKAVKRQWEGQ